GERRASGAEGEGECGGGNTRQRDSDDAFHGSTPLLFVTSPCGRRRSYGAIASTDARSQRRELTSCDHRSGGQTGGRAARRLQRYRKHRVVFCQRRKFGGQGKHHWLIGPQ